jgi:hypothetical protein
LQRSAIPNLQRCALKQAEAEGNQRYRQAYVQEFNFNNEIQLNNTTSVQFGYVGELGQRLINYRNGNQLTTAQAASLTALGLTSGSPVSAIPAADLAPLSNLVGENGTVETFDTEGISTYNALQITMCHRISKGFQATVNYTWAKSTTDTNGNFGAADSSGPNGIQDGYNLRSDYGPSELDVRHNLSANGSYNILRSSCYDHRERCQQYRQLLLRSASKPVSSAKDCQP